MILLNNRVFLVPIMPHAATIPMVPLLSVDARMVTQKTQSMLFATNVPQISTTMSLKQLAQSVQVELRVVIIKWVSLLYVDAPRDILLIKSTVSATFLVLLPNIMTLLN
jgi:hypothetical protein